MERLGLVRLRWRRLAEVVVPALVIGAAVLAMTLLGRSSWWPLVVAAGGVAVIVWLSRLRSLFWCSLSFDARHSYSWEGLRSLIAATIKLGHLSLMAPEHMRQGSRTSVSIVISSEMDDPELTHELDSPSTESPTRIFDIETSPIMSVECRSADFTVVPLSPSEQAVVNGATWQFEIIANSHGRCVLRFFVRLYLSTLQSPMIGIGRNALFLEHVIDVTMRPLYEARNFWIHNWQWLLATFIGLGGAITAWIKLVG